MTHEYLNEICFYTDYTKFPETTDEIKAVEAARVQVAEIPAYERVLDPENTWQGWDTRQHARVETGGESRNSPRRGGSQ